ncbi:TPM domain-containing protein [Lysobacter sp. A3-1-A15]|uniref:TPM domain-containing protein n=1 Tax=Novilysobacter viscosus TaxID=3098602 RepID=UPI002EDA4F81
MRWLRHVFAPSVEGWLDAAAMGRITRAIEDSERLHDAELCFAVEAGLPASALWDGQSVRERAREVFARLGVWDTAGNNGVLLYLLVADHRIEIVADRGFDGRVDAAQWRVACERIEHGLRDGGPGDAIVAGIDAMAALIAPHFPPGETGRGDELCNRPRVL